MRKAMIPVFLLAIVWAMGPATHAADSTNFANDGFASQITMDAFNQSVKHRMQIARFGFYGDISAPPAQFEVAGNAGAGYCPPRQFNVYVDGYYQWGKQKTGDGYKFNVGGPVLGFEWTNGPFTWGIAGTHSWGKLKAQDMDHERKTRMWGVTTYGQWNYERFYVNAAVSYGRNRFKSTRYTIGGVDVADPGRAKYHSNAWNAEMEIGTRLNICNFVLEPHIGIRYFHDKRKAFDESLRSTGALLNDISRRNYHALEMPLGLDIAYQFAAFNTMIMPRLHFAWVPQFDRQLGKADSATISERTKRARHGFELGAGFQTKVFRTIDAHVDYNVNMRSKAYEHVLTAGFGVSF